MAGTIGIKIANGDFYPILTESTLSKKRLVLTTVHDGQESVQIDLFRSLSKSMLDAQYIGSLVVENIKPSSKGEPSIEMAITSGKDGNITADAWLTGAEHHLLNVSLKTIDSSDQEENYPDFDLEKQETQTPAGLYGLSGTSTKEEKRKFPWGIVILAALLAIIILGLLWFFFLGGKDKLPFIQGQSASTSSVQQIASPPSAPPAEPPVVTVSPPVDPAPTPVV
jgi:hypothetical protein